MNKVHAYLLGLLCGRGQLLKEDKRIVIEFAHKNKVVPGIAHCPNCGNLATKPEDNASTELICKECHRTVPESTKKLYEQRKSTLKSLRNQIIPFLSQEFKITYDFVGNDHMTLLIMDFEEHEDTFEHILQSFNGVLSFGLFEIPDELKKSTKENKIEFINGLLDTAGFFNAGSWFMRSNDAKKEIYVMRGYFQIVNRNWKMPIEICDFLYKEFSLTLQTIDWGHPNNRDQSNIYAWTREHQLKFFPEEYAKFVKLRLTHKQEMFNELVEHNRKLGNYIKDVYGLAPINKGQIKPYHPAENDPRLPSEIRGRHFDASWQISLNLGSIYMKNIFNKPKNPKLVYLTGKDDEKDYAEVERVYEAIRKEKTDLVENERKEVVEKMIKAEKSRLRENPEMKLYSPISAWFEKYFSKKYGEKIRFYDTSSFHLNKFILENNLYNEYESYEEYKIKPDLVGFRLSAKKMFIAEIKANELILKDLGQLRGYCLVANPEFAALISKEEPSLTLKKLLKINNSALLYGAGKRIEIGVWNGADINFIGT